MHDYFDEELITLGKRLRRARKKHEQQLLRAIRQDEKAQRRKSKKNARTTKARASAR